MEREKPLTALITGASSGIGKEMTMRLAQMGHNIVMVSRSEATLNKLKSKLEELHGIEAHVIPSDLSDTNSPSQIFNECQKRSITIDILINNAGIGLATPVEYNDRESLKQMLNLNITSLTLMCSLFAEPMKERHFGYIMNVSSVLSSFPLPFAMTYSITKSYVLDYTKALRYELQEHGISVTAFRPGTTDTNFFEGSSFDVPNNISKMLPDKVARIGIEAMFKKKKQVVAGVSNKFMGFLLKIMPHSFLYRMMKDVYKNDKNKHKTKD
jgi:hypothetical protein